MDDAIDLSMSFDDNDDDDDNNFFDVDHRPSSPHNTKETAIVIDDSDGDDDDDDMAQQKMPAARRRQPQWSSSAFRLAKNYNAAFGSSASAPPTCASCGDSGNNLQKCSACKSVHYCNTQCQHSHWSTHKPECHKLRSSTSMVKRETYATSTTTARVSLSPTMNNNHAPSSSATATTTTVVVNRNKRFRCSLKKCRKQQLTRIKAGGRGGRGGGWGAVKAEKRPKKEKEEGVEDDVEEADEITYTRYKPQKLKFGLDHPDAVVENSTLSAVIPPEVEYNLGMPADILSTGKLSNLQLEAIVYGCQRHLVDLPLKDEAEFLEGGVVVEKKPVRAGFLLGDGAGEFFVINYLTRRLANTFFSPCVYTCLDK